MLTLLLTVAQAETAPAGTDWKPTIAAVVAIVAGAVATSVVSIRVANIQARRAEMDRLHQRRLANDGRVYEARSVTYVDLLISTYRLREDIRRTDPVLGAAPDEEPRISDAEWRKLNAQVVAHGSGEVKNLLVEWREKQKELYGLVFDLSQLKGQEEPYFEPATEREEKEIEMSAAREAALRKVKEIEDRVNVELNLETYAASES